MIRKSYLKYYHYLIEISDVKQRILNDPNLLAYAKSFAQKLGIKVLKSIKHEFQPLGTTILLILSFSHLSLHTWPEHDYIHIDLLSCNRLNKTNIKSIAKKIFESKSVILRQIHY